MSFTPAAARRAFRAAAAVAALALALPAQEKVDVAAIERIKAEEARHSQVMDIESWLTDVHGPRLTGSPITKMAGDWAITTMKSWGLANPHYETWGPFGRGWSIERFSAQIVAPHPAPLIAYPGAWSTGTNGPVTGEVVRVTLDSTRDLDAARGKLRGKWVMFTAPPNVVAHFTPQGSRYTNDHLDSMALAVPPAEPGGRGGAGGRGGRGGAVPGVVDAATRTKFLVDEGALGVLQNGGGGTPGGVLPAGGPGGRGGGAGPAPANRDFGTVAVQGTGSRAADAPSSVPTVILAVEHYGRIWRMLEKNVPVSIEVNAQVKFYDTDLNSFNVVAEIPGTDPRLKDEVVMVGAHFDSWHGGTGATDNAAGSAVMMEAMRLIKTLNLQPRRTIRIGLWTGEEQGLLGSRAYVTQHFGAAGSPTPEHAKFSAYFNVDNGTGKIRGVYQQGNFDVAPVFDAWMAPFKYQGMRTLTISNTGGTDHQSFDGVGLPGFQFIQDPVEYDTRTHHTNQDVYERIQPEDMKFNSAVVAAFAWQAAQRDEKLPRKSQVRTTP
jgi:hypothetical protein